VKTTNSAFDEPAVAKKSVCQTLSLIFKAMTMSNSMFNNLAFSKSELVKLFTLIFKSSENSVVVIDQ
jgi:hypothetical protein